MDSAVDILQKHFNLVKTILFRSQDAGASFSVPEADKKKKNPNAFVPKDLDIARLYIGISKGNQLMGSYVGALDSDMASLLDWKLVRGEHMFIV
jgi:hypothetical protein